MRQPELSVRTMNYIETSIGNCRGGFVGIVLLEVDILML